MTSANLPIASVSKPISTFDPGSDSLFRAYVEAASDIVYTLDLTGQFTFVNPYGLKLIGTDRYDEVVGHSYLDIVAPEYHKPTLEAFSNLLKTGELRDYEFVVLTKTGNRVFIEVNGRLLYQSGQLVGALGIGRDITERKRFEAQLKMFSMALDSAHDSALITDLDGNILYANLATQRIFGWPQARLTGTNLEVFFQNQDQVRYVLERATGEGWSDQIVCQRYNGQTFTAFVSVSPVYGEGEDVPNAVSIILRDITQQETIKAELASKNLELARANRLKTEFLANMSHELRTPMTSILGFSSLLEQQVYGDLNDRQRLYVNQIHQSGEHLLSLINEVLDLSKVEAGQMDLHVTSICVDSICDDILKMVETQTEMKNLVVHRQVAPDLPVLMADEMRVRQMLLNLLSNAIKFTHKGLSIGLQVEQQGDYLNLTVWDEGIGIPEDQLSSLFQPFQQLDSSLSKQYEGTGLGLALTQKLTRLHGGDITVKSEPNKGTRFTIHLPLDCRTVSRHDKQYSLPDEASSEHSEWKMPTLPNSAITGRVLVVEDNPINALLLEHMLNHWGYEATHCPDGPTALTWLESNRPILILMDVHLPGMDGLDVTQRIRQNSEWADIPIVATTALARPRDRDRCFEAGMQDYISKPINSAKLVSILAKYTWGED
ncbi:PAS domain S-box protein [Oscillatoria sp. CS-180]|uniref:PAS domain S-box protein n=1 Tax=Oscillatoria sp. CS-180 TaxID=3021720 RepID=UPI00232E321B|nr:PAS domain S-box protein [Oscillatoria sp. CS-180]MDB9525912.1 PAS domain S-box protein [Oscillatoria sp. CS-180]